MSITTRNGRKVRVVEFAGGGFEVYRGGRQVMVCDGTGRSLIRGNMRARFTSAQVARRYVVEVM